VTVDRAEVDAQSAKQQVRPRLGEMRACYERGLKDRPDLSGKVVLGWTITPAGTVEGVHVQSDTLQNPRVLDCMTSLVARWRFSAPPAGNAVQVAFPFVFSGST